MKQLCRALNDRLGHAGVASKLRNARSYGRNYD
jgi:hypothetical protein